MSTPAPAAADPLPPVAAARRPSGAATLDAPSLRILIADDFAVARQFLTRSLQRLGQRSDEVADGAQAIAALTAAPYDLLLLDLSMPHVDGIAVIRWLRSGACPWPAPHIAVISALAVEERPALHALDVHTLLPKPVRRAQLAELLAGMSALR